MRDIALVAVLVASLAVFLTVHVTIAFGLARRSRLSRGLVALVIAPLAPLLAWRDHMRARAAIWGASLVVYVVARVAGRT